MGVRFLQSYIEGTRIKGLRKKVNLIEVAKKSHKLGRDKVLVIDLNCVLRSSYGNLDLQNGGDFASFQDLWERFISKLESEGIKPLIVIDGPTPEEKRPVWIERRQNCLKSYVYKVFDTLNDLNPENWKEIDMDEFNTTALPHLQAGEMLRYNLGLYDSVFTSKYGVDADRVCAALAEKFNAFGILTGDTDFLIYQISPHINIFWTKYFDWSSLNGVIFQREKIARHFGLKLEQMPIFASLNGNDIVTPEDLRSFHLKICDRNYENCHENYNFSLMEELADFIANLRIDWTYAYLSEKVFGNPSMADRLKKSIETYQFHTLDDIETTLGNEIVVEEDHVWSKLTEQALESQSLIYNLMCGAPFQLGNLLEDFRNQKSLPAVGNLMKISRQRLYGILFYDKKGAMNQNKTMFGVLEWCFGPETINEPKFVRPVCPPHEFHPGLTILWKNRKERSISDEIPTNYEDKDENAVEISRWKLFSFMVNPELDPRILKEIPTQHLFMVSILYIMQHEWMFPLMTKREVITFILMNLRLKSMNPNQRLKIVEALKKKKKPLKLNPRAVHLATIFTSNLLDSFSVCVGYVVPRKHLLNVNNFEGTFYHYIYNGIQDVEFLDEFYKNSIEKTNVEIYFRTITSDGRKVKTDWFDEE